MKRTPFARKASKPMQRKQMRAKAKTPKAAPKSATGLMVEGWRMDAIHRLPCAACGCSGPVEAHHCKDRPPFVELGVYRYFPGYKQKSADADAIPLCLPCHWLFHNNHGEYALRHGVDYQHIPPTRATLSHMELDY